MNFCRDCRWCNVDRTDWEYARCQHPIHGPTAVNKISGNIVYAYCRNTRPRFDDPLLGCTIFAPKPTLWQKVTAVCIDKCLWIQRFIPKKGANKQKPLQYINIAQHQRPQTDEVFLEQRFMDDQPF